jgi:hypothetical protein
MSKLNFHSVLKNSYASRDKQKGAFKNEGYVYDSDLSNGNNSVYFNPKDKKILMSVKGTNPFSLKDIGTDIYLAAGKLKDTDRYKESKNILEKAKKRYNNANATLASHSLGGSISQYIAGKDDKVYTLDKGATIGTPTRGNETAYRSKGDLVSLLSAGNTRMTTLKRPSSIGMFRTVGLLAGGKPGGLVGNALDAHDISNIKQSNIMI